MKRPWSGPGRPYRMPGLATWKGYDTLVALVMSHTPPAELCATVTLMLRRAHEKGAFSMKARCIKAVHKGMKATDRSREAMAEKIIAEIKAVPWEGKGTLRNYTINSKRVTPFFRPKLPDVLASRAYRARKKMTEHAAS